MKRFDSTMAAAALLVTISIVTTGCQSTGNWIAKKFGSSEPKTQYAGNPQTPKLPPPEEITTEKRTNIQLTMARAHERQGNFERALALYEEAVQTAPKSAEAHHRLAVMHDKHGQVDQSHEHYRAALKYDPKNATIHSDYGYSCYLQGRMKDAERHLRHAVAIDPRHARAHNNLGILLARTGRPDQALAAFHAAGGNEGEARVNLAMGLLSEGKLDEASEQLNLVANVRGISEETRAKMVRMQSLVARVDPREAAPVPPSTLTAGAPSPRANSAGVMRASGTTPSPSTDFVSASAPPAAPQRR